MVKRVQELLLVIAGTLALLTTNCGDDDCQAAVAKLCDRPCECTEGPVCAITYATGMRATVLLGSPSDCEDRYVRLSGLDCGRPEAAMIDFAACSAALDAAMCLDTPSGRLGLVSPEACTRVMGGGP